MPDLLLPPGRYALAVNRSATADGTPPATDGYRVDITPGTPMPPVVDTEPNDEPATAGPVSDAFRASGVLDTSPDQFAWTISPSAATQAWQVSLAAAVRSSVSLDAR